MCGGLKTQRNTKCQMMRLVLIIPMLAYICYKVQITVPKVRSHTCQVVSEEKQIIFWILFELNHELQICLTFLTCKITFKIDRVCCKDSKILFSLV